MNDVSNTAPTYGMFVPGDQAPSAFGNVEAQRAGVKGAGSRGTALPKARPGNGQAPLSPKSGAALKEIARMRIELDVHREIHAVTIECLDEIRQLLASWRQSSQRAEPGPRSQEGTTTPQSAVVSGSSTVEDLLIGLFAARGVTDITHLRDRLDFIQKAYALLYGLIGKCPTPVTVANLPRGPKLSMEEHGAFIRAEFDRLMDAFDCGLPEFRDARDNPANCAVQRSTYVALLYALARGGGIADDWNESLNEVAEFLENHAVRGTGPHSGDTKQFRAVLGLGCADRPMDQATTIFHRHRAGGRLLLRWQEISGLILDPDCYDFTIAQPYPRIPFWDHDICTLDLPHDLRAVAGPVAKEAIRSSA